MRGKFTSFEELELYVEPLADISMEFSGSLTVKAEPKEVLHEVQVWQTQTEFLNAFLNKHKYVMSIVLEGGIVIGDEQAVQESRESPSTSEQLQSDAETNKERSTDQLSASNAPTRRNHFLIVAMAIRSAFLL